MSVAEATNPDALHQSGDFVACNDRRALHVGIGETLFQSAMDLARLGQRCGVAMSWCNAFSAGAECSHFSSERRPTRADARSRLLLVISGEVTTR